MKRTVVTPLTYKLLKNHKQKFSEPSQTVPDQSYSIKEILEKFTRGIDPMLTKIGSYEFENDEGEEELDNLDSLELDDLTSIDIATDRLMDLKRKEEAYKNWIAAAKKEREIQPTAQDTVK